MRRIPCVETADAIRLTDATDTPLGQRRQHVVGCKELALFIEEVTVAQDDMRAGIEALERACIQLQDQQDKKAGGA